MTESSSHEAETAAPQLPVCPGCGNRCGLFLCACCGLHCKFPWRCDDCQEGEHDQPCMSSPPDQRDPTSCPKCGEVCTYDGWGLVHASGLGIGSCSTIPPDKEADRG